MIILSPQTSQKGTMIIRVQNGTWNTTFDQYEILMIKDGESHAIIRSGTLTDCDARDRSLRGSMIYHKL